MQVEKQVSYTLHLSQRDATALLNALAWFSTGFEDGPHQPADLRVALKVAREMYRTLQLSGVPSRSLENEKEYGLGAALEEPGNEEYDPEPEPEFELPEIEQRPPPKRTPPPRPPARDPAKRPPSRATVSENDNLIARRTKDSGQVVKQIPGASRAPTRRASTQSLSVDEIAALDAEIAALEQDG